MGNIRSTGRPRDPVGRACGTPANALAAPTPHWPVAAAPGRGSSPPWSGGWSGAGRAARWSISPTTPLGRPVAARTTTTLDPSAVGGEVVLLFEDGDPARPIVVGVVRPPDDVPGVPAEAGRGTGAAHRRPGDRPAVRGGEHHADAGREGADPRHLRPHPVVRSEPDQGGGGGDQLTMWQVRELHPVRRRRATGSGTGTGPRSGWSPSGVRSGSTRTGRPSVADEQDPPVPGPEVPRRPGRKSSLLYDSDFYLTKPTTDVLLHGHAYAPGGKPATQVDVTMRVGDVRKTLRVTGDRPYRGRARPRSRRGAAVHPDAADLRAGLRRRRSRTRREDPDRPRFERPQPGRHRVRPGRGEDRPRTSSTPGSASGSRPAGFGPIPPHWQPRVRYAGTYDEAWQRDRCPLYPPTWTTGSSSARPRTSGRRSSSAAASRSSC